MDYIYYNTTYKSMYLENEKFYYKRFAYKGLVDEFTVLVT